MEGATESRERAMGGGYGILFGWVARKGGRKDSKAGKEGLSGGICRLQIGDWRLETGD